MDPYRAVITPVVAFGNVANYRTPWWRITGIPGGLIWNTQTVAGKRLTTAQVKTLLTGKTTRELTGFRTKAGRPFTARLQLDALGHVVMLFEPPTSTPGSSRPGSSQTAKS